LARVRKATHTPGDIVDLFKRVKAYNELDIDALEIQPTFLTSKRIDVDEKNNDELAKNPNETVFYRSSDEINGDLLEGVAPSVLKLKVGAQVMLTVNVDVEGGLTNGARGVVTQLGSDHIFVKFKNGRSVSFERHPYMIEEDKKVMAKRSQFPICLAYCLSIHKSQGSTLDCAVIEAGNSIFSHHSVYVALSRVRSLDGLYLKNFNPYKITVDPRVVAFYEKEEQEV
jgi:ATP-dependent DNA helicase PIF1